MKRTIICILFLCILFLMGTGLYAEPFRVEEISDSAEIRSQISSVWLSGEIDSVLFLENTEYTDRYVTTFSVSQKVEKGSGLLSITVMPVVASGSQGKWILYRRISDGMPASIRIYPKAEDSIFLELYPDGANPEKGKTRLDFTIAGARVCRDVPVGLPFTRLYTAPLSIIVSMTAQTVPWSLLQPDLLRYSEIRSGVETIREEICSLVYFNDGAFNENAEPVLIEDGTKQSPQKILSAMVLGQNPLRIIGGVNCSGFAKWIIDGIIRPRAGQGLYIEPLKKSTASPSTHFTEPYRESRDLFFALDWTRNLASAVVSLQSKKTVLPESSGVDITVQPFAESTQYEKNVGYDTIQIIPLLYYLAVTEPGHFYLGAISREMGEPLLRQFHHVVALFPYFDEEGKFFVAVFESAVETPIKTFLKNNSGSYINLVRVRIPEKGFFQP